MIWQVVTCLFLVSCFEITTSFWIDKNEHENDYNDREPQAVKHSLETLHELDESVSDLPCKLSEDDFKSNTRIMRNQDYSDDLENEMKTELETAIQLRANILTTLQYMILHLNLTQSNYGQLKSLELIMSALDNREIFLAELLPLINILQYSQKDPVLQLLEYLSEIYPSVYKNSFMILKLYLLNNLNSMQDSWMYNRIMDHIPSIYKPLGKEYNLESYFKPLIMNFRYELLKWKKVSSQLLWKIFESFPFRMKTPHFKQQMRNIYTILNKGSKFSIFITESDVDISKFLLRVLMGYPDTYIVQRRLRDLYSNKNLRETEPELIDFQRYIIYENIEFPKDAWFKNIKKYDFPNDVFEGFETLLGQKTVLTNIFSNLPDYMPSFINSNDMIVSVMDTIARRGPIVTNTPEYIIDTATSLYLHTKHMFLYNDINFEDIQQYEITEFFKFYAHIQDPTFVKALTALKTEIQRRPFTKHIPVKFHEPPRKLFLKNLALIFTENNIYLQNLITRFVKHLDQNGDFIISISDNINELIDIAPPNDSGVYMNEIFDGTGRKSMNPIPKTKTKYYSPLSPNFYPKKPLDMNPEVKYLSARPILLSVSSNLDNITNSDTSYNHRNLIHSPFKILPFVKAIRHHFKDIPKYFWTATEQRDKNWNNFTLSAAIKRSNISDNQEKSQNANKQSQKKFTKEFESPLQLQNNPESDVDEQNIAVTNLINEMLSRTKHIEILYNTTKRPKISKGAINKNSEFHNIISKDIQNVTTKEPNEYGSSKPKNILTNTKHLNFLKYLDYDEIKNKPLKDINTLLDTLVTKEDTEPITSELPVNFFHTDKNPNMKEKNSLDLSNDILNSSRRAGGKLEQSVDSNYKNQNKQAYLSLGKLIPNIMESFKSSPTDQTTESNEYPEFEPELPGFPMGHSIFPDLEDLEVSDFEGETEPPYLYNEKTLGTEGVFMIKKPFDHISEYDYQGDDYPSDDSSSIKSNDKGKIKPTPYPVFRRRKMANTDVDYSNSFKSMAAENPTEKSFELENLRDNQGTPLSFEHNIALDDDSKSSNKNETEYTGTTDFMTTSNEAILHTEEAVNPNINNKSITKSKITNIVHPVNYSFAPSQRTRQIWFKLVNMMNNSTKQPLRNPNKSNNTMSTMFKVFETLFKSRKPKTYQKRSSENIFQQEKSFKIPHTDSILNPEKAILNNTQPITYTESISIATTLTNKEGREDINNNTQKDHSTTEYIDSSSKNYENQPELQKYDHLLDEEIKENGEMKRHYVYKKSNPDYNIEKVAGDTDTDKISYGGTVKESEKKIFNFDEKTELDLDMATFSFESIPEEYKKYVEGYTNNHKAAAENLEREISTNMKPNQMISHQGYSTKNGSKYTPVPDTIYKRSIVKEFDFPNQYESNLSEEDDNTEIKTETTSVDTGTAPLNKRYIRVLRKGHGPNMPISLPRFIWSKYGNKKVQK